MKPNRIQQPTPMSPFGKALFESFDPKSNRPLLANLPEVERTFTTKQQKPRETMLNAGCA